MILQIIYAFVFQRILIVLLVINLLLVHSVHQVIFYQTESVNLAQMISAIFVSNKLSAINAFLSLIYQMVNVSAVKILTVKNVLRVSLVVCCVNKISQYKLAYALLSQTYVGMVFYSKTQMNNVMMETKYKMMVAILAKSKKILNVHTTA